MTHAMLMLSYNMSRIPLLFLASMATSALGQGTLTWITFDGPPPQPLGTAIVLQQYFEAGMSFTPIDPNAPWSGFVRRGVPTNPGWPDNGTTYLQADLTSTLKFSFSDGSFFNLVSVDLAEYSTLFQSPLTVHFVGYRHDGSIVTTDFTTDGIIDGTGPLADFQTFTFDSRFTGLDRVEIPIFGWSLDNLYVVVPEPSCLALFGLGGLFFVVHLLRRRRSSH
jgi:hypothetical protein